MTDISGKPKLGEQENKRGNAPNDQSSKAYRDWIINQLEVPSDIGFEKFPSQAKEDESKVADELDDTAENDDFVEEVEGKVAVQYKAGSTEIEHKAEAKIFSKEHDVESSSVVVGQKSSGLPKSVGKEDIRDGHRGA